MGISTWRQYQICTMDETTLRVVLDLVRTHVERFHSYPTVVELKAAVVENRT